MNALRGLEIGAGALLSLSAFADLFNSVVLPRPAINKFVLGRRLFTALWSGWRLVGDRLSQERREGWLGTFGPIASWSCSASGPWPSCLATGSSSTASATRWSRCPPT